MKILAIVQSWNEADPIRGFTVRFIEALAEKVDWVTVIALEAHHGSQKKNVSVRSLGKERTSWFPRRLRYLSAWHRCLRQAFADAPIDAVFTHMAPLYSLLALPYCAPRGIPVVTWFSHVRIHPLNRLALRLSSRVISVAPEVLRYARPGTGVLTTSGVDTNAFSFVEYPPPGKPVIVTVARLSAVKEFDTLLDAAKLLRENHPNFTWWIIGDAGLGDPTYEERIRDRVKREGLDSHILFLGARPPKDIPALLAQATIFVLLERVTGIGKALIEAMACGVPGVTCARNFDDQYGALRALLTVPEADPQGVADRLSRLLALPAEEMKKIRRHVRQMAETRSLDRLASLIGETLREASAASHASSPK